MAQRTAAAIVRSVREQARAEIVRSAVRNERAIFRAWGPIFRRLSARLATASSSEVAALIEQAQRELAAVAVQFAASSIRTGANVGVDAERTQNGQLTQPGGPVPAAPSAAPQQGAGRAEFIASARIAGQYARDGIPLSARLYRGIAEVSASATRVVRSGIVAREGIFQTAENFISENRSAMRVPVPRYTQDLIAAARHALDSGDRQELLDAIAQHARQMDRLGVGRDRRDGLTSLRSTVRQFVQDLQRATPQNIDRLIARHLEDRAQYQARRVVRSETAEAHRQAFLVGLRDREYVVGVRWTLSSAHPRPDVCDCFANQALYDLGPGGYPLNQVPETPHPHCLCQHTPIIDEQYASRRLARLRGEPEPPKPWEGHPNESAEQWLARQPASFQSALLGPTRAAILADPHDRRPVIDARGVPIPVRDVLAGARTPVASAPKGSPPPAARSAPVVASAPTPPPPPAARVRAEGQVPLPTSPAAALADVGRALRNPKAQGGIVLREASRQLYQSIFPDSRSWDLRLGRIQSGVVSVRHIKANGSVPGSHSFQGRLSLDTRWVRIAQTGFEAMASGRSLTAMQQAAISTVLHETAHEHSPVLQSAIFVPGASTPGHVVEEVTTELLARTAMRSLGLATDADVRRGPAYQGEINRVVRALRVHVPSLSDADELHVMETIVAATHRIRDRSKPFETHGEYVRVFGEAMGVPDAEMSLFGLRLGTM